MTKCYFCGLQHLKPPTRKIDLKTRKVTVRLGNLNYVRDKWGEYKPVCADCYEDIRYGTAKGYKVVM